MNIDVAHRNAAGVRVAPVVRFGGIAQEMDLDLIAAEDPLEIVAVTADGTRHSLGVTLRTPGDDAALVLGMLFAEGIVCSADQVHVQEFSDDGCGSRSATAVTVRLDQSVSLTAGVLKRVGVKTSACGLCGRETIEGIVSTLPVRRFHGRAQIRSATLLGLPGALLDHQVGFLRTGGVHAAALFSPEGILRHVAEDIGRHNAVDKVIGRALQSDTSLQDSILFLSGRAGFELVQKAARANIPVVASVGAPSSLAVDVADRAAVTLVGFLRDRGFNVYTGESRIQQTATPVVHNNNRHVYPRLRVS